uniref:Major facilitator superfamily (MFS) profile domain-containing protein n=1 Tax=Bionectria ochroleuca TaxID=29856 RepID=A0A8H7KAI1_BIOOC
MLTFLRDHNYKVTQHLTTNLMLASMVMMTSVFSYGFENSVLSTIQAMTAYERQFGEKNAKTGEWEFSATRLAMLNSLPLITYAIGVVGASFIGERYGRRIVFVIINSFCLAGIALSYAGKSFDYAMAGRMIIQLHVGGEAWLVPMWMAEVVPAAVRGSMVGLYAFSHVLAGFIASVITDQTSKMDDNNSWRIPVGCMFIFPSFAILTSFLLPESPRWLLRQGNHDKAVEMIYYLRSADRDFPAEAEIHRIQDTINETPTKGKETNQVMIQRRTWGGLIAAGAVQLTGQSFASNYGTIFLKSVGVIDPFTGTMIKRAGILIGCIFVISFVEKIGRRRVALVVGSISAACLMVMGGLGTVTPPNPSAQKGVLAMSIIFPCAYMIAFGSTMTVVKSEIPHTALRDKSNLLFWSFSNLANFLATFTLPYLLRAPYANLGSRVGFIYGCTSTLFVVLLFFFVPEMTGKSLEEIDEMFESRIPAWRSRGFKATGAAASVTEIEAHGRTSIDSAKVRGIEHVESK